MRSMTGYGRATAKVGGPGTGTRLVVEVRSVNHRGLDVKIRAERPDAFCDVEITRAIRAVVDRGTVTVGIRDERPGEDALDLDRIRRAHAVLDRIRREVGLSEPVDLATVAAFLAEAGAGQNPLHGEEMWRVLQPVVDAALVGLLETRDREGAALRVDLATRLDRVDVIVAGVESAVEPLSARFAQRLGERLVALRDSPGFDPGRVAQEVALMAERLDVTEELVRLRTHLRHFRDLLDAAAPVGRKLDFVIQEIGREINTVGSKAQDAAIAAQVIEGKAELEKIREQAQNIE